jgi:hypothetical protein
MKVKLLGPDQKPLDEEYEFVKEVDKNVILVKDSEGLNLRVHRSRVIEQGQKAQNPGSGKENAMTQPAKKEEKKVKEEKVEKKVKKTPVPFDIVAWAKENGGASAVHLKKEGEFSKNCPNHKMVTHLVINPTDNVYYILNVYQYPDNTLSLGENNKGGNKYPLKGKRFNVRQKAKDTGQEVSKTFIGSKTAQEIEATYIKRGYTKL